MAAEEAVELLDRDQQFTGLTKPRHRLFRGLASLVLNGGPRWIGAKAQVFYAVLNLLSQVSKRELFL